MIVITDSHIIKCSELCVIDSEIIGFIDNCKDCSFTVYAYGNNEEAKEHFKIAADAVKKHGENVVMDFRR